MNALVSVENRSGFAMNEDEIIDVLQVSLYPGAALKSIKAVIGYCRATGLDPMQKPVHIVPMWDKNAKAMRDVIMPGIALYRTQAARSGLLAGISEPEFGPDVEFDLSGVKITVPEWSRVTAKRILSNGAIGEFSAIEYWIENYATKSKDTTEPNAMWKKRTRGQLAKCAEAQALRKGFPEMVGAAPTADEMEGKSFEQEIDITPRTEIKEIARAEPEVLSQEIFDSNAVAWQRLVLDGRKTAETLLMFIESKSALSDQQKAIIRSWEKAKAPAASPAAADAFDSALDAAGPYTPE